MGLDVHGHLYVHVQDMELFVYMYAMSVYERAALVGTAERVCLHSYFQDCCAK